MDNQIYNLLLFIFLVYGISTIISTEYLFATFVDKFKKYDKLYYLLTCNSCLSVWIGFIVSFCGLTIIHPAIDPFIAYTGTNLINFISPEE